jgi:hypothetical protein
MTGDTAVRRTAAVERLYGVFGLIPRPARVEGCPHCVAPDEDRPLLDRPVRSIAPANLARYAAKALNTWGDVAEFRYFVPRLLECASHDSFDYPDPAIVFGKLTVTNWRAWPAEEIAAIESFLTAWWADALDRYPAQPEIGVVLCSVASTGTDLIPLLDTWGRLADDAAIRHLHEFVLNDVRWWSPPQITAFWDVHGAAHRQVVEWLTGGRLVGAVETAFEAETREEILRLLAETHSWLTLTPAGSHAHE